MDGFNRRVVKIGTITMLCTIITDFFPVLYLWVIYGGTPTSSQPASILNVISATSAMNWIAQPLSYYGGLGMVGIYISWISGSAADIRLPSIDMAQKMTNTEASIPEGDTIGAMALSTSIFTTIGIISVFTVVGSRIIPLPPEVITQSFTHIQPALFAAVFVNMAVKNLKPGFTTLALGLLCCFALLRLGLSTVWLMLIVVVGGLVIGILFACRGARKIAPGSK